MRDRPATDEAATPDLSVIVVAYNEAERIGACLDAIFAACRGVTTFEVLLVDSNSTDDTVSIASEYDITIFEIPSDSLARPGAGRYVGTKHATGDALLFVDGDVTVTDTGWLEEGLTALRTDPALAGVDGYLNERRSEDPSSVDYLHGVALYDREALESVGGYHPFLTAWEDLDLGFQLTLSGYGLRRLPRVVGHHPLSSSPLEQLRRWRRGYYRASGQVCHKALTRPPLLSRWLWYFRDKVITTTWLTLGLGSLFLGPLVAAGWILTTLVCTGVVCHRLGPNAGLQRAISTVLFPLGFALGFRRVPDRDRFPVQAVRSIQTGSVHLAPTPSTDAA